MATCDYCSRTAVTMQTIGVGRYSRRVPVCAEHSSKGKKSESFDAKAFNKSLQERK